MKVIRLVGGLIALTSIATVSFSAKITQRYDLDLKTSNIGNYEIVVESHEIPSHETLPILNSSLFGTSDATLHTEVDNDKPYAEYSSNTITKVDVVFASGELAQQELFDNLTNSFKSMINSTANNFDTVVHAVETVTGGFDMNNADAHQIFGGWEQYPSPNAFTLNGNWVTNICFSDFGPIGANTGFNQVFMDPESWDATKLKLTCTMSCHGCEIGSGLIFRWNKEMDEGYMVLSTSRNNYLRVARVKNISNKFGARAGVLTPGKLFDYDESLYKVLGSATESYSAGSYSGGNKNITVTMDGGKIEVKSGDRILISCEDPNPIECGGCGLFAGCCAGFSNVAFAYDKTVRKSLGESIDSVAWRDNSVRFIVHATDVVPKECLPGNEADYAYTINKLLSSNAYLVNIGNGTNDDELQQLIDDIMQADKTPKGELFYNNPMTTAMQESADYIVRIAGNLSKPTNWVLVNTELKWDTKYIDGEKDLPLNFGEHDGTGKQPQDKSDVNLATSFGVPLTHYYTDNKIQAERWRYRHFFDYFDNNMGEAPFDSVWIEDPVEIFEQVGKFRVNYKRRDNPFYTDSKLSSPFDEYRYWSDNYDYKSY